MSLSIFSAILIGPLAKLTRFYTSIKIHAYEYLLLLLISALENTINGHPLERRHFALNHARKLRHELIKILSSQYCKKERKESVVIHILKCQWQFR